MQKINLNFTDELLNKVIINFYNFLNMSNIIFKEIRSLTRNTSFVEELNNDFCQTNWEILVESVICLSGKEFLDIYGEGAECNKNSSRVSFYKKKATHKIICKGKTQKLHCDKYTNNMIELDLYKFNSFASLNNNNFYDVILLEHLFKDEYAIIDFFEIEFIKVPI